MGCDRVRDPASAGPTAPSPARAVVLSEPTPHRRAPAYASSPKHPHKTAGASETRPSCGDRRDDDKRLALLRRELRSHVCFPAEGSDLGGRHTEPNLAVSGLSDREAQGLGARFGQVAVFSWRGPQWSVLACTAGRRSDLGWEMTKS